MLKPTVQTVVPNHSYSHLIRFAADGSQTFYPIIAWLVETEPDGARTVYVEPITYPADAVSDCWCVEHAHGVFSFPDAEFLSLQDAMAYAQTLFADREKAHA
jgi:hypothetical protein